MEHLWLNLRAVDIQTERLQCEQEGKDLSSVLDLFDEVTNADVASVAGSRAANDLLDRTINLPTLPGYSYSEPSDLEGIQAATPSPIHLSDKLDSAKLESQIHGAWLGRCAGCLLGKPVEGWRRDRLWPYLKEQGLWPLNQYISYESSPVELRDRLGVVRREDFIDFVTCMPEDDDTNYTTAALAMAEKFGKQVTSDQVAEFWLDNIPILHTCTAERVAYRNLVERIPPPYSATTRNPYREWIGAQIRADLWGYIHPGDPAAAAAAAWADAAVSHVKNGIYGEMWAAAMVAAAFETTIPQEIIRAGLGQIPVRCRLTSAIEDVLEWEEVGCDYDTAVYRVHEIWDENREHDWCHTIPNAMIVAIALLYGEGDFGTTICRAVQACFDTDCNGATAGSIFGAAHGSGAISDVWTASLKDTIRTGVAGFHETKISELAQRTYRLAAN